MGFLIFEEEVRIANTKDISLSDKVPLGFWKLDFDKHSGAFLRKTEVKLSHGKIYGNSQAIADHVIAAFEKSQNNKNLGVLLSGGKGLGKTLTTRLVIEELSKKYPVIVISSYFNGMVEFLEKIKGCVILMDEFEKFMSGNICGNDAENEQTKQETMLSLLDGNTGSEGNLFLLTVNDPYSVDTNLKSRPGRVRYHFRFSSESADVVREYCKDNLKNKDNIEETVNALGMISFVSMDIIAAFVQELNDFPELKPMEVIGYFNVDNNCSRCKFIVTCSDEQNNIYRFDASTHGADSLNRCSLRLIVEDCDKYKSMDSVYTVINCSYPCNLIPKFITSEIELDPELLTVHSITKDNATTVPTKELKVISVCLSNPDAEAVSKRYLNAKKHSGITC